MLGPGVKMRRGVGFEAMLGIGARIVWGWKEDLSRAPPTLLLPDKQSVKAGD